MFRRIEDVRKTWQEESQRTLKAFEAIPDGALEQAVNAEHRDLKRMAWHLVETLIEMPERLGIQVEGSHLRTEGRMADPPSSVEAIRAAYGRASDSLIAALSAWSDDELDREDEMYGETWRRGFTFWVLVIHEVHHRGQMTVLMRQAGLKVPDLYGPAKEGWAAYGMEAPKV